MIIGVLKENKEGESRVIVTPTGVSELCRCGHTVLVQKDAGTQAGFSNDEYVEAGAQLRESMQDIYAESELVAKVKELFPEEYDLIREDQIMLACFHPAANREETDVMLDRKIIGFAAEDTHRYGSPNCEVAGKLGAIMGTLCLTTMYGGSGKLVGGMGGAPGINAIVIGAGIVGKGATEVLASLGAKVILMDVNVGVLRSCGTIFPKNVHTAFSNQKNIADLLPTTDLVINCVKWPKHRKDHLISRDMLKLMQKGSAIVDISADLGGAIETYRPTSHHNPTYIVDGIVHYGVDNIPGAVPHTTSIAYAAVVLPHLLSIANNGVEEACKRDAYLRRSLVTYKGTLTHAETALIQNRERITPEEMLGLTDCQNLDRI
ncbi:alanine dehydrogenase [Pelosinus sp. sgz500959]|uniref:alanine dehydrogenase n=1 Tax=Pelosinus sp. sgz500959 TaxID=3242472 RepID=UPI00366CB9D7